MRLHSPITPAFFSFALSFVALVSGFARQTPEVQVDLANHQFSIGDLLQMRHIGLSEPSLIHALKNPDPEVRWLAAVKLQEDKAVEAIPEVRQALAVEKTPRARVNISVALGLLGDPGGRDELKKLCADGSFPPEFRLYAVAYMFDLGVKRDEGCLHVAEQMVQIVDADYRTIGYRSKALELLPRFRGLTSEESQQVFQLVAGRLNDPEPTVRMQAAQSLVALENAAAIPYLETAIAKEQQEAVRPALEEDLRKLQEIGKR